MTAEQVLESIIDYLTNSFPQVDVVADADARTGSRFIYVRDAAGRHIVELTQRFLDADRDSRIR